MDASSFIPVANITDKSEWRHIIFKKSRLTNGRSFFMTVEKKTNPAKKC